MIEYQNSLEGISPDMLAGFFVGWPNPPSAEVHLRILQGSSHVVLAVDGKQVVGFITAISDSVSTAYIPFLEVLPDYQKRGIGKELVRRLLAQLQNFYMIDLTCDKELIPFYESLGLHPATAMSIRNYTRQASD